MPGRWASLPAKDDPLVMLRRTRSMLDEMLQIAGPWRAAATGSDSWVHDATSTVYLGCEGLPAPPPSNSVWSVQEATWQRAGDTGRLNATLTHTVHRTVLRVQASWQVRPSEEALGPLPKATVVGVERPWRWVLPHVQALQDEGFFQPPKETP